MVVLSLMLTPRVNRIVNIVVSLVYIITIIGSAIGETWVYYLLASLIEVILLVAIARTAWKWAATSDRTLAAIGNQRAQPASLSAEQRHDEPARIGRRSTSVPVATLFRSSADARAAVLRVRSFRSRDSGSSNHLDALFQNRSDVGRWIGLWSLEAGPRHDEILTDLLRTSCIG